MKKLNRLTLTLLSGLILTACGGSGGNSPSAPKKENLANHNAPQTNIVSPKPNNNTKKESNKSAEPNSNKALNPNNTAQNTPPSTKIEENKSQPEVGNTIPNTEKPSNPQVKPQQELKTEPQPPSVSKPNNTETKKSDNPAMAEKEEKPISPNESNNPMSTPLTNAAIFEKFSRNGGSFESGKWISLKLDDQDKIQVLPLHDKMVFSDNQNVEGLFDQSGRLLGYVGYTSFTHLETDINNPENEIVTHYTLPMLEMDASQKVRPTHNINYKGDFYYYYKDRPVTALKGDVNASYRAEDKRLFLELFGQNKEYWDLKENVRQRGVNVTENGEIFGQLYADKTRNATFEGGIYGKNGEVLAGELTYDDHSARENNSWKGVLGAKAQDK